MVRLYQYFFLADKAKYMFWLNGTGHFNKRQLTVKYCGVKVGEKRIHNQAKAQ